ncbi:hypothetical protein [Periweissella cryptocerci]|nr:hypothetical protein [Periweissella cryptocerci]
MSMFVAGMASVNGILTIVNPTGTSIGMTPEMLQIGPFHSYLVPAIILLIMIVGGNLAIIVNLLRKTEQFSYLLMIVGTFQTEFIIIQLLMFGMINWLHVIYLLYGIYQVGAGIRYFGLYYDN